MVVLDTRISDITVEEVLQFGFPVLIGLAIIALVFAYIAKRKRDAENDAQPILEENAKVIGKQEVASNAIAFEVWVMFETETGKRVRLNCKPNDVYIVGDEGCLKWQGTRLYSFERGKRAVPQNKTAQSTVYGASPASQGYIPAWKRVEMMEAEKAAQKKEDDHGKCRFCGAEMQAGQMFCGFCGKRRDT